jgi:hypothetical protein
MTIRTGAIAYLLGQRRDPAIRRTLGITAADLVPWAHATTYLAT